MGNHWQGRRSDDSAALLALFREPKSTPFGGPGVWPRIYAELSRQSVLGPLYPCPQDGAGTRARKGRYRDLHGPQVVAEHQLAEG